MSGSSLLTLGFASVDTVFTRVLAFSEAALGLVLLALMIAFLPSMYSTFSKRETQVALLEVRAGSPPSAVVFLERYHPAISYDPDPNPDDQISITRVEFDEACALLVEAGVPLKSDLDQAWRDYAGWRVNYDTVLLDLAELTMAPYAPWTADRSAPSRKRPRLRGWGRSLKRKPDPVTIR